MHIGLFAPVELSSFDEFLDPSSKERLRGAKSANAPAPTALALELLRRGHSVTIVTYGTREPELRLTGRNLSIVRVPGYRPRSEILGGWRRSIIGMADEMDMAGPDVVHAHWTYEFALAAKRTRAPAIVTIRDAPITVLRYEPDAYRLARFCMALSFRFLPAKKRVELAGVSPYMASVWKRQMLDPRPVRILPNIPLMSRNAIAHREKAPFPLIVDLASAVPRKNVWALLQAFAVMRKDLPDAELHLIGHGLATHDDLAVRARHAKLERNVTFVGPVSREKSQIALRRAWVHAHLALEESFGNTLIEAMSLGTAIVADKNAGAVPWVLADGLAGVLVDTREREKVAEVLGNLLRDQSRRHKLVLGAQKVLAERHAIEKTMHEHLRCYEQILTAYRESWSDTKK